MKFIIICLFGAIALSCLLETITAQQPVFRPRPYFHPKPQPQPRPIRIRRQVLSGSVAGTDAQLQLSKGIGTPNHNVVGSAFASGSTDGRTPVTTGGALNYNNNGHGVGLAQSHTPGVRDTFSQNAHVNLLSTDRHNLDANAFASQNKLANGFKFERNGVGLDYNHANGHGASLTHSHIPNFGNQVELGGKANLWSSQDRNTKLDLTGRGSQWTTGPLKGQRDFGGNLGLTHFFG